MRDPRRGLTHEADATPWRRLADETARLASAVGLERSARLVAVALVPVFLIVTTVDRFVPLYTALIVYVLVTSFAHRNRYLRTADVAVASALVVATGGEVLPFLFFLIVAVAGPAAHGGLLAGLAVGSTLSTVLIVTLAAVQRLDGMGVAELLPVLLLPLVGVTTGAAAQVYGHGEGHDRRRLQEANRLLSALRSIADDLPGGLDVTTVAAALVAEARRLPGATAVLVYASDDGVLKPVASSGLSPGTLPTLRLDQLRELTRPGRAALRSLARLPPELHTAGEGHRWWIVTGMYRGEDLVGTLLVGVDDPDAARSARPVLLSLAADGALAMHNALLFDGTRERAAQAARRHLAGDLHDGVAQSLAHLRLELELLAMTSSEPGKAELIRLSGVARTALQDLRATISGLRSSDSQNLAQSIRRHIDYLTKPHGPQIEFEHIGDSRIRAVAGEDVLRVLQEALSNALRHARADHVRVGLEVDTELLRLVVEDDGVGAAEASDNRGGGVGIRSMEERAARLGGRLTVRPRDGGGTVVELRCPSLAVDAGDLRTGSPPLASAPPSGAGHGAAAGPRTPPDGSTTGSRP